MFSTKKDEVIQLFSKNSQQQTSNPKLLYKKICLQDMGNNRSYSSLCMATIHALATGTNA
jgi:hypothetical protein